MSAEIFKACGVDAVLIEGAGGIFDVRRDGELLFSKHASGRFPEPGEIARLLGTD